MTTQNERVKCELESLFIQPACCDDKMSSQI